MNLLRALATVSSLTMVSRVLGFVRDFLIAAVFGAGLATDAFFVAFKIPNLLRRLFAEGAFSQAFVPILAEYKNATRRGRDPAPGRPRRDDALPRARGRDGARRRRGPAHRLRHRAGVRREPEKFGLTVTMLRITFPYIVFISLVSLAAGVLNTWNRFAVPAFTPTLLNVAFIVGALLFARHFDPPVLVLAWAVFAGGVLQLAFQIPALARIGMLPRWRLDARRPGRAADPAAHGAGGRSACRSARSSSC